MLETIGFICGLLIDVARILLVSLPMKLIFVILRRLQGLNYALVAIQVDLYKHDALREGEPCEVCKAPIIECDQPNGEVLTTCRCGSWCD